MNKDIESIFKNAKSITLTHSEKSRILREILDTTPIAATEELEAETVRNIETPRLYETGRVSPFAHYYSRLNLTRTRAVGSLAAVVVLLGITGVNAQNALPGDLLYPMKVHVNEKLAYMKARTPEARATLEAAFATRRLEEAAELLYANKLTVRASEQLAVGFSIYSEKLARHVEDLTHSGEEERADAINMQFATSLNTHREVLSILAASSSSSKRLLRSIELTSKATGTSSSPIPLQKGEVTAATSFTSSGAADVKLKPLTAATGTQSFHATTSLKEEPRASGTPSSNPPKVEGTSSSTLEINAETKLPPFTPRNF